MVGTDVSHYKVLEKLGEGGMGVVYKAHDTKLDRTVALKFLPPHLTTSQDDKTRFVREAKSAATLNHPNVCTIYDIQEYKETENGTEHLFIVMEYVEGHSLREKLPSLPFKQAIEFGIQIADGLAAAHEHGIVHRDIKPENIMARKDGRVLVMDFGLAKVRGTTTRLTREGSTVGTAGYMSPEQIQGWDTDHRSDIFSLGVVLYELFTGQLPFKGVHETALSYEIVNVDPEPASSVKPDIDSALDTIIQDCLEKDPGERCQSAAEVARNLRRFKRSSSKHRVSGVKASDVTPSAPQQVSKRAMKLQSPYMVMSIIVLLLAIFVITQFFGSGDSIDRGMIRAYIHPEPGTRLHYLGPNAGPVAVSPDGSTVTYTGTNAAGQNVLWVRRLDALEPHQLRGTEGAMSPFWSPDSRYIGFFADGNLKRISASGGIPESITDVWLGFGGTWNEEGTILFSGGPLNPISKISVTGGDPVVITEVDESRGEFGHRWPHFLPDGKHFLYLIHGGEPEIEGVYIGSIDSDMKKFLFRNLSQAYYVPGYILFVRENILYAQPFDSRRLEITGDSVPIADPVMEFTPAMSYAGFSASQNGILAYHSGEIEVGASIAISNRNGDIIKRGGDPRPYGSSRLSPDQTKIAVNILEPERRTNDIWWIDIERDVSNRITYAEPFQYYPIWSPDGNSVAFLEIQENAFKLKTKSIFDTDDEQIVYRSARGFVPNHWSPDGRYIAMHKVGEQEATADIWALPLDDNEDPFPIAQTHFNDVYPAFSPDGRWIAYESNETGRPEIYVRPFPGPGRRWQVSTEGGGRPIWTKNGREVIYMDQMRNITAVEITIRENDIEVGERQTLFNPVRMVNLRYFDVSANGETIIYPTLPGAGEHDYITLVVNWDTGMQ